MHLLSLKLHNFRRFDQAEFTFGPQTNLVWGPNAQGKTTILEALYLFSTGRSFRAHHPKDLIRSGTEAYLIDATFMKHGVEQTLRIASDGKERRIQHNSTQYSSAASLLGILPSVIVTPDDASLVKSAPQTRRRYLDIQLAQIDPLYVHHLTRYTRAMQQRNTLLRMRSTLAIETWEQQMAAAAAYLTQQRRQAVADLEQRAGRLYGILSGGAEELALRYRGASECQENHFLEQYAKHRPRELEIGYTTSGPHKDDLIITLSDREARYFASEGQQRSCVAALRLAEWERLCSLAEEPPLMLYDDVGMSMDLQRRERLFGCLEGLQQVFLTSTDEQVGGAGAVSGGADDKMRKIFLTG